MIERTKYKCRYCDAETTNGRICNKCHKKLPLVRTLLKMVRDTKKTIEENKRRW